MTARNRKVIVIGGGIGGLTTALALLKRGLDVDVYEQASRLGELGAGIQISPNGTRVLLALGLEQELQAIAVAPLRKEIRHWRTGKTWNWYDLGTTSSEKYGSPHVLLHRGDLHGLLVNALQQAKPGAIHLSQRCVGVRQNDSSVDVEFENGEKVSAPYVIGADGIHSKIREQLFGSSQPDFTGCVAWRAVVPMRSLPPRAATMVSTNWLGPRGHVLHYPIRGGELLYFLGIVERDDWQVESWTVEGSRGELANDFPGWHPDVQAIIDNVERPFKWALMVRGPMPQWSKGRVTLMGDACHPTLPFMGQGGVMAIEDAYVVAACIDKYYEQPEAAFARYEDIRRERTAAVVLKSHENRKQAFNPALANQDEAVVSVAEEWQQSLARERLDWVYTYDATAIAI
jgi:salicylate hydroxylase